MDEYIMVYRNNGGVTFVDTFKTEEEMLTTYKRLALMCENAPHWPAFKDFQLGNVVWMKQADLKKVQLT